MQYVMKFYRWNMIFIGNIYKNIFYKYNLIIWYNMPTIQNYSIQINNSPTVTTTRTATYVENNYLSN